MVLFEFATADAVSAPTLLSSYVEACRPVRGPGPTGLLDDHRPVRSPRPSICTLWLDQAPLPPSAPGSLPRFAEFVDSPLTRDVIDTLLDAIA